MSGNGCPVEGCVARLGYGAYRTRHFTLPHVRCRCGWVGMAKAHGAHRAMIRRHAEAAGTDPGCHDVDAILTDHLTPQAVEPPPSPPPPADPRPVIEI